MSDHTLPPDPSSWPTDPYRLLGVDRTVSSRDLRKAYNRLIRIYKPEHAPEEFRRIRDAYESALPLAKYRESTQDAPEDDAPGFPFAGQPWPVNFPHPDRTGPAESPRAEPPSAGPDPWRLACEGDPGSAYKALAERSGPGDPREETYLQLYWLLALRPGLDAARQPADWLIRGIDASGPGSPRLRELLRRAIAADPALALGDRVGTFLRRKAAPELVLDVAEGRWRAARGLQRWGLILDDVHALRNRLPGADPSAWAGVLIAAATHLAWADDTEADQAARFAREVELLGDRRSDHAEELYQVEFVQVVKKGLDHLGGRSGNFAGLFHLLALSWDERGPEYRARFRSYVGQIAQDPQASLNVLDHVHGVAPAVLGRLSTLLGNLDFEPYRYLGPDLLAELSPVLGRFLDTNGWNDYPLVRPSLLTFCLREAISPGLVARVLSERPEFLLAGKAPLAQAIVEDWPLRHVYRACELGREAPAEVRFGD